MTLVGIEVFWYGGTATELTAVTKDLVEFVYEENPPFIVL
jgi:hypothetical protein